MNLQPYARVIAYSYLLMPSDHEVNDAVADAGRDVEEERWDDQTTEKCQFDLKANFCLRQIGT